MGGITGPREVFEGPKGFMDTVTGRFEIAWAKEDLERVTRTILKRYNAEIHSQSAVEAVLELRHQHGVRAADIEAIEADIFDVAYHIIGGGGYPAAGQLARPVPALLDQSDGGKEAQP